MVKKKTQAKTDVATDKTPRKRSTQTAKPTRTRAAARRTKRPTPRGNGANGQEKQPSALRRLISKQPRWVIWSFSGAILLVYAVALYYCFLRPYLYRWNTEDIYFYQPVVHGIDISHHQGKVDWAALNKNHIQNSPLQFVFMKATEGSDLVDTTFQQNFRDALDYGFIRGAYHFFSPLSSASEQAAFFIKNVKLLPHDLPPVLDVERRGTYSSESLRTEVKTWLRIVEDYYKVKPIIYASYKFKTRYLNDSLLNTYPYWIAHYYVDTLEYQGEWTFWQHHDNGSLEGIEGDVDMNVFNGDLQKLLQLTIPEDSTSQSVPADSVSQSAGADSYEALPIE